MVKGVENGSRISSIKPKLVSLGNGLVYAETSNFEDWNQNYQSPSIEETDELYKRSDIIIDENLVSEEVDNWNVGKVRDNPPTYLMNYQEFSGEPRSFTGYLTIGDNEGDITVIGNQDLLNSPYNTELRIHLMPEVFEKTSFNDVEEALSQHDRTSIINHRDLN